MKHKPVTIKTKAGVEYIIQIYNNANDIMLTANGTTTVIPANSSHYQLINELLGVAPITVNGVTVNTAEDSNIFEASTRELYKQELGEDYDVKSSLTDLYSKHRYNVAIEQAKNVEPLQVSKPILSNKFKGE